MWMSFQLQPLLDKTFSGTDSIIRMKWGDKHEQLVLDKGPFERQSTRAEATGPACSWLLSQS